MPTSNKKTASTIDSVLIFPSTIIPIDASFLSPSLSHEPLLCLIKPESIYNLSLSTILTNPAVIMLNAFFLLLLLFSKIIINCSINLSICYYLKPTFNFQNNCS
jgi:hypothetical protein